MIVGQVTSQVNNLYSPEENVEDVSEAGDNPGLSLARVIISLPFLFVVRIGIHLVVKVAQSRRPFTVYGNLRCTLWGT